MFRYTYEYVIGKRDELEHTLLVSGSEKRPIVVCRDSHLRANIHCNIETR